VGSLHKDAAEQGKETRPSGAGASKAALDRKPSLDTIEGALQMQRTIGNRTAARLTQGGHLQRKLNVAPAGDKYEREADDVADEVMRNLSPTTRSGDGDDGEVRRSLVEGTVGLEGGPISADAEAEIGRHRGGGTPLPEGLRQSMGQSFGADLSAVRVHTGPAADELSRSMQARAFTVGSDIFLARGQYRPDTTSGQRLLAHELTHTVQQGAVGRTLTPAAPSVQRLAVRSDNLGDWTNLASGKASGGVNGVIFAKAADNSEVVVKGMSEPPQRVMLAQDIFESMGVATSDTRPVAVSSKLGQHILQELLALAGRMGGGIPDAGAITAKATAWQGYQTLLLMAPANVKNMGQLVASGPGLAPPQAANFLGGARGADFTQHVTWWTNMLTNQQMWEDFGRVFYIDQFLGNEDRFENMKMQNIFIDPTTFRVIALDNDVIAADYISQITEVDAIANRNNPTTVVVSLTPDNYIESIINGGMIYNGGIQARALASLNEISGRSGELKAKVDQKALTFLQTMQGGVANGRSVNERAASQVLTDVLANQNNALTNARTGMTLGAVRARERIQELFRTKNRAEHFGALFDRQLAAYKKGFETKVDTLYNWLALRIRYVYLAYRAGDLDHQAALTQVQNEFRAQVASIARTATTEKDQNYADVVTNLSKKKKPK
jgi:hypothetical protein